MSDSQPSSTDLNAMLAEMSVETENFALAARSPVTDLAAGWLAPRYFLPYQIRWIRDPSRMCFAEKSVRIGWTFADALKNVRKRIAHKKREQIFPKDQPDVAQDFFALRKIFAGNKWKFTEGRNLLNPASHCDIAWAGGLATRADGQNADPGPVFLFENTRQSRIIADRMDRSVLG